MKKTTAKLLCRMAFMAATILTASTTVCSCSDNDSPPAIETDDPELPPVDSMKVHTKLNTYIFPYEYKHTGAALVKRVLVQSPAFDTQVETAILHDGYVPSLTDADYQNIAQLIARGGNMVYCDATNDGIDIFLRRLKAAGAYLIGDGSLPMTTDGYHACRSIMSIEENASGKLVPRFVDNDDTDGKLCDIIAFRGNSKHVVSDLGENRNIKTATGSDPANTAENISTSTATDIPLDYMYGLHADKTAAWLDARTDDETSQKMAERLFSHQANTEDMDLDKYTKAQEVQYSFNVYAGHKFAPVTVTYYIWTANDRNGADFYLCHQEIAFESSKLVCGPTEAKTWNVYKVAKAFGDVTKNPRAYWAYMTRLATQVKFSDQNVELTSVSPANDISGQTSYKESMEWSLNAAFVASADPHASLTGGVKINKEWSYNIPDLKMTYKRNKNMPKWEYTASSAAIPEYSYHHTGCTHSFAKEILYNDCEMGHSWIWKVNNADKKYTFSTDVHIDIQGLWMDKDIETKHGYKTFSNSNSKSITLLPPPRYEQEWLMRMTPNNPTAFASMEKTFKNYWVENFSLYTVEQNDTTAINNWINDLKVVLKSNPQSIKDAGLGEFTLTWKQLKKAEDYKSYTYKP